MGKRRSILAWGIWVLMVACPLSAVGAEPASRTLRDPLELRALGEPRAVLQELHAALAEANQHNDRHRRALLLLARANACRVIADWDCQRIAGTEVQAIARGLDDPLLEVRGLINEALADVAQRQYSHAGQRLGQAELVLKRQPVDVLYADIQLGFSAMSAASGKHAMAARYAERGLAALGAGQVSPIRARLLRNLAQAQMGLDQWSAARTTLVQARRAVEAVKDPKLEAELALAWARLARTSGLVAQQREEGERVLAIATTLDNAQLEAMGREVLGNAAADAGDSVAAAREYARAAALFRQLDLLREEQRLLRQLISVQARSGVPSALREDAFARFLAVDEAVEFADRAQALDEFEAQLKYAQQAKDVARLAHETEVAQHRATALAERNRLIVGLQILTAVVLMLMLGSYRQARQRNRRLREALDTVREREAQTSGLMRVTRGCVLLHDVAGRIILANPAAAEAFGADSVEAMRGQSLQALLPGGVAETVDAYLAKVRSEGTGEGVLGVPVAAGGNRYWQCASSYVEPADATPYIVTQAVEVTLHNLELEALREQGLRDALTGAYNRRELERFEQRHADGASWAVIAFDLDEFKQINDRQGHEFGDAVLKATVRFLADRVRADDVVVRMGGDEFVVLLPHSGAAALERIVERLREDARQAPCSYSMGSALRENGESLVATLARADAAMYIGKRALGMSQRSQTVLKG